MRVFCERVGGGFGGKQEMLTEDICSFAAIKTGRPVKLEFTREEEFTATTTRHPAKLHLKVGATRDGQLTAIHLSYVYNTGAYGNHGAAVLFHSTGESMSIYRCANKKTDAYSVYTNTVPSGAFRGYGLSQTIFAMESAIDEVARGIGMDPVEFRRRNVVRPPDPFVSLSEEAEDLDYGGSYGLDQCITLVDEALKRGNGVAAPEGPDWLVGQGMAVGMIATVPPTEHRSEARLGLEADGHFHIAIGSPEFGNGSTTVRQQIIASIMNSLPSRVRFLQADTDRTPYDTGPFGSAGMVVAGKATQYAAEALRDRILDSAASHFGKERDKCRMALDAVVCNGASIPLSEIAAAAHKAGQPLEMARKAYWPPRRGLQLPCGFRIAVHQVTGEIVILQSVREVDAGVVVNPKRLRGQVEGAIAQGTRLGALREMVSTAMGASAILRSGIIGFQRTRTSRTARSTSRQLTTLPVGAKSMSRPAESCGALCKRWPTQPEFVLATFPRPDNIYQRIYESQAG